MVVLEDLLMCMIEFMVALEEENVIGIVKGCWSSWTVLIGWLVTHFFKMVAEKSISYKPGDCLTMIWCRRKV